MNGQGEQMHNDVCYANFLSARRHNFAPAADNFVLIAALIA